MNKLYFAMGLHFHQPVGNFDSILERAYINCYRAFVERFSQYQDFLKITLHFSGNLFDYFEKEHPEFLEDITRLVDSGHVEIMGGGYYEPIFQVIPERDRVGQIEMMSEYCEKRFGRRPVGIWVPERVWSPGLVSDFYDCGMRYTVLDDWHLIKAGVKHSRMYGYFITGSANRKLAVFPTDKKLRYILPFKSPGETIGYFRQILKRQGTPLVINVDDGEKFGEWPWTYNWVYKKRWLDRFFKELIKNREWIEMVTLSECLNFFGPLGEVRIPETSYEEMMEWSGGGWTNYLVRYSEANQMHKRMWYVSDSVNKVELQNPDPESRNKLEIAKKELYKAQTNCPYWHGVFGGIYLHHLRSAVYKHLINADRIVCQVKHKDTDGKVDIREVDFYHRSRKAVMLDNRDFFIIIEPCNGGVIRELDYKPGSVNLINTMTRRWEYYHKKIIERIDNRIITPIEPYEAIKTVDRRIENGIYYDRYDRVCLIDHFIKKDLALEDFINCNYEDIGNFSAASFAASIEDNKVVLSRQGKVDGSPVLIEKCISIPAEKEVKISYTLRNNSSCDIDFLFGMEFNLSLPYADSERYNYETDGNALGRLCSYGSVPAVRLFCIRDSENELGVRFSYSEATSKVWYFPVHTVSQSERAYDFNYQCSCLFPVWQVKLPSQKGKRLDIVWSFL